MPDEGGCFQWRTRGYGNHRILQNAVVSEGESYSLIFDV